MVSNTEARSTVLRRIRGAVADRASTSSEHAVSAWRDLPRRYIRQSALRREQILELLEDRLRDYDAHVERVPRTALPSAIKRRLLQNGTPRMIVPAGIPADALSSGFFTEDAGFDPASLNAFGGVMTFATLAIALTGTLVLQNVSGQGRRAITLIPDYHLCLVDVDSVVETVPEAMAHLQRTASLATTFISGPSATADIEMTRIKGVHGPRVLDVLLVEKLPETS